MYVGRIVAVGRTAAGQAAAMYRVSSRSFPNRTAKVIGDSVAIVPKPGHEQMVFENPYVSYNCVRMAGEVCIVTNGSQTDPIAEKVSAGMPVRDAMASVLLSLDYEKDDYNTPRIAAAIAPGADSGWLGIVCHDGLMVCELPLAPGEAYYVATYEKNVVSPDQRSAFDAPDAAAGAQFMVTGGAFADMTNAVTSVCALDTGGRFELATLDL
jgi:IMP cyclohydrolase